MTAGSSALARAREIELLEAYVATLESELRRCRTRAAQTERLGRIGSWELDLDAGKLTWSEGTYRIFGLTSGQPITLDRAVGFFTEEARARLEVVMAEAIATGEPYDITAEHLSADGVRRWNRSIGQLEVDATGARRMIGMVREVTEEQTAADRLRHLGGHDPLTGLCNRRILLETLEQALAPGAAVPSLALLLLDVDRFKDVNDLHGHDVGDLLLVEVARRLRAGVPASDTVARLGGDEFALILYGVATAEEATARLGSLLALFLPPAVLRSGPLPIGVSLGAAVFPDGGATPGTMLKNADIALYQAKNLGRGQGFVFHQGLGAALERRLGLLAEVRGALARGELDVFYQPIIDLRTLVVRGLEALVRWRHPERGLLPPGAFQEALSDPALSAEIGSFVLVRALGQMREWLAAGEPVTCVNVNITESQLRHGDVFVREVMAALEANGLAPENLKLEILEGAFLGHQSGLVFETLAWLQSSGIMVALDDFGTGYASLTHLKQFDVSRIKIDRSFIQGVGTDASSTAISLAIVDLGRNLGIRVTAEGIEDSAQLALLLEAKCDCGQGYLFARPMPAEDVPGFLARWAVEGPGVIEAARTHHLRYDGRL